MIAVHQEKEGTEIMNNQNQMITKLAQTALMAALC